LNPYEIANQLAEAIVMHPDIQRLKQLKMRIRNQPVAKSMMDDFFSKQKALAYLYEAGHAPTQQQMEEIRKLAQVLSNHPLCHEYIDLEMKIANLMNELQQIISEPIRLATWYSEEIEPKE
jgi:cell fate (sporulation/competence/biofilm development) regulator YlbF (YheA/YmcA/DUF963 family)